MASCSSTPSVQFAGLRERAEAAKSRVSKHASQVGHQVENARDEFRTRAGQAADKAKDRFDQAIGQSRVDGSLLSRAEERVSTLKAKVADGFVGLKERVQGLLNRGDRSE